MPVQTRTKRPDRLVKVLRPSISLPHPCSRTVKWLRLGKAERERYEEVYEAVEYRGIPASERFWCDTESRILGWPKLVQQDVDLDQTGTGAFRLLVQLPARFGPGGSLYFFIPEADLAQAQFDGCELVEQNT